MITMEPQSLRTASSYINNLLLSRGLLRNGVPIEFAPPSKGEEGRDATMAKVMNLVHDLILRRDHETETMTTVSQSLQRLRISSTQQSQTIERLEVRNAELERQLALNSAQERAVRTSLKSAETRTRALKEEVARLKGTVGQIRGQCANEIRRRDEDIKKLKRHLEGRRGRDGSGTQVGVVVLRPATNTSQQRSNHVENEVDLGSPEYSLKQETTEFLTKLSQRLSDENDSLIGLVRSTLSTLRNLQGLPKDPESEWNGAEHVELKYNNVGLVAPPSYEDLAASTDEVLYHLRGLLTNPSFVPLEEVEIREDEIIRLREGWEKMEARWKEAVALMNGWRKRMVNTGDTVNLEDLRIGLKLGGELPPISIVPENLVLKEETLNEDLNSSRSLDMEGHEMYKSLSKAGAIDDTSVNGLDSAVVPFREVLRVRSPNVRSLLSPSPKPFSLICEESIKQFRNEEQETLRFSYSPYEPQSSPERSKLPLRRQVKCSPSASPRTVAQKLATAQTEADAVRKLEETGVRKKISGGGTRKLKNSRRRSTLSPEELENLLGNL